MKALRNLWHWLDARLAVSTLIWPVLTHPIPRAAAGPMGWWYVFGSASLTLFAIQVLTGIGLAVVYVPSAGEAYASLIHLNTAQPLGWFLRALHYYAGSGMVVMVLLHMTQVFLHGSYKYPRELTWCVGIGLFACLMGMFFTGQVLRWDPDAYWGIAVGASMAGRVPVVGPWVVDVLLGGPIIGGNTLARFFALHVFVIPGLLVTLLVLHLWLILSRGISAPPVAGQPVDPSTYDNEYRDAITDGVPFFGDAMIKDMLASALVVIAVVCIAAVAGPKGPSAPPDPTAPGANPRPEWPFLWLFALLSLSPPQAETFIMLVFPVLLVLALLAVPFVNNRGERAPSRRPVAALAAVMLAAIVGILTYEGVQAPWSPVMTAWSADPIPVRIVERSSPEELMGAAVFQNKNCRNCHALDGLGGRRGPDLTTVGGRLSRNKLIDQVSNGTPGGGNMPAYGKQIAPDELDVLATFLVSLRPSGRPPAQSPMHNSP